MKMVLSLLISMMFISSCQKGVEQPVNDSKTLMNISYGPDSLHRMDIYLPAGRSTDSTKVIFLIHGGAWMEGDKRDFASSIIVLKERLPDYAVVNLNYRLATQTTNHFPTQENDVKAAIEYVYSRKGEYNISDKYILLGASAGGHLALLHAYKHTSPVKVKAVVSFFGPTDLAAMYNSQTNAFYQYALGLLIGGTPTANPAVYNQSSPIHYANANSAPTILLHGGKDPLVNINQSVTLYNKLQASGVPSELVTYPNEGHGWYGSTLTDSFNKIFAFLKANVQ